MKHALLIVGGILVLAGVLFFIHQKAPVPTSGESAAVLPGAQPAANPPAGNLPTAPGSPQNGMHLVTIKTNLGEIKFETFDADAPKTVKNFLTLAGKGFYNGLTFHRVVKGFVIQGGDPNGDGTGGPGYTFEDELNPASDSYRDGYRRGVVAMANAGPNTNGSQFFIMLQDVPLPHNYTIFGKVVAGQEVVDAIGAVKTGLNDKPLQPVTMRSVTVEEQQ